MQVLGNWWWCGPGLNRAIDWMGKGDYNQITASPCISLLWTQFSHHFFQLMIHIISLPRILQDSGSFKINAQIIQHFSLQKVELNSLLLSVAWTYWLTSNKQNVVKVTVCKEDTAGGQEVATHSWNLRSFIFFKRLLEISVIFTWEDTERTQWIRLGVALHSFYMSESAACIVRSQLGFYFVSY